MGGKSSKFVFFRKTTAPSTIEQKMVDALRKRAASGGSSLKSFNSVIMRFHKIDESFEKVRDVFRKFDKDSNGTIDVQELKDCFHELQVSLTDEEITEFHHICDMDESKGIEFNEFIVVLSLVYLLEEPANPISKSRIRLPDLEATFDTIVDTFVFFDKDGDGYVSKNEILRAINEASPGGRAADRIGMRRFEEMDFDKNGMITFKEFLFAFTHWVGVDDDDDDDDDK
ncbi:hypothetical protein KI387_026942, partial [Taxus chinensis]